MRVSSVDFAFGLTALRSKFRASMASRVTVHEWSESPRDDRSVKNSSNQSIVSGCFLVTLMSERS